MHQHQRKIRRTSPISIYISFSVLTPWPNIRKSKYRKQPVKLESCRSAIVTVWLKNFSWVLLIYSSQFRSVLQPRSPMSAMWP